MSKTNRINKTFILLIILVFLLGFFTPVLADYIGPQRTVTTYTTETVEYGVWADKNDSSCNPKLGEACIQCEWEGDPFKAPCAIRPPTSTYYYYSLGFTTSVVEVQTTYPAATINSTLQNCTLQNSWCVTSPQLQITANEPVSGYQILLIEGIHNSQQFACTDNPCNYPVVNEGTNTLEYWALSSWGDSSTKKTANIKVDTVLPNLNLLVNGVLGSNNWYVSDTIITAEGTDGTSGIYEKVLSIDNGNTWIPSKTLSDGVYQVDIKVTDNAYNVSTASTTISVDTTTPTLSLNVTGTKGNNNYYVSNVTITPNANDATSGVERIEVTVDGGQWTVIHAPVTLTDGVHTYQFRVYDNAGNMTETPVQNIKVDTTPPAIDLTNILDLGDMFAYSLQDDGSGLSVVRLVIEDEKERFPKVTWEEKISGNKFKSDFIWDGKWKDKSTASIGEYIIFVKASDQAGNERISYGLVTVNPLSYFQSIPEFIVPESEETNNELTSELENEETNEQNFGGTTSQTENLSTTQTFELVVEGVSNGMTSSNVLPPVSNILTGALAVTAIAAAMKVVNDAQKKREEEEEQSYQQAKNQAAKLNQAEEERKAQQWLEGQAILNAQIEALQKLGASDADIQALKEQASTQGLGIAINNAQGLNTFYQEKKIAELMLMDTTEQERYEAYISTPEYIAYQEALAEWQAQQDAELAYQLYRQGEWASLPIQENIVKDKPWWQVILDPVAEFMAGVGYQAIIVNNLNPLIAITPAPESVKNSWFAGWSEFEVNSPAFILGRIVGGVLGIIQGVWEITSGIATATGGTLISCGTGILCLGDGAASIAVGTALVVHGSVVLANSAYNTGQQIQVLLSSSNGQSGSNKSSGRPSNNIAQNRQFNGAVHEIERKIGRKLTKNEIRQLHDSIHHLEDPGYWDIVEEGLNLFGD